MALRKRSQPTKAAALWQGAEDDEDDAAFDQLELRSLDEQDEEEEQNNEDDLNAADDEEEGEEDDLQDFEDNDDDAEEDEEEQDVEVEEKVEEQEGEDKKEVVPWKPANFFSQTTDSDSESSDEEHSRNTVGRIPMEWYEDYPHIGYDLDGKRIMKPAKGDELEKFLDQMEDPDKWWRSVQDKTGKKVELTDQELEMINRITGGKFPDADYDPYEDYGDFFTRDKMIHAVSDTPEPKRRFVPSKWEAKKVMKLVRAIRNGWITTRKQQAPATRYYNIWDSNNDPQRNVPEVMKIPAPKMKLPDHSESYNPPAEFLLTEQERKDWEDLDPEDRPQNYIPQKFDRLRHVPSYSQFVKERFERCLDLYLCPRVQKNRINIDPESLIPTLPKPRDLQPFPSMLSLTYDGHTDKVRSISVDPTGFWLATGSDDRTARLWEIATGRCIHVWNFPESVTVVRFNPSAAIFLLAALSGNSAYFLTHDCAPTAVLDLTNNLIREVFEKASSGSKEDLATWTRASDEQQSDGHRFSIKHFKAVKDLCWHHKGDYFATVCPEGNSRAVLVHQLSKQSTQNPFRKLQGPVQRVLFHPSKPLFFVATQRYVRVYNLLKQELAKKLQSGVRWISSIAVHPKGDNLIVGSYDKRLCWFDLELADKPYRVLRYHAFAIRQVAFHPRFPLFASCSDDATVHIFHGMVYSDSLQNPLIVPVKILKGHGISDHLGILDCQFHPTQPWIFTCGADQTVRLFT